MSRSRVMPPASPTTAASTTTPKRSSFARTAASPPLRPKTNVPARFRTRISVGSKPCGTSTVDQHDRSYAGRVVTVVRVVGLLAVAALLFLGAAGLSGQLVDDDYCAAWGTEVSSLGYDTRWAPPGVECVASAPGHVTRGGRTG